MTKAIPCEEAIQLNIWDTWQPHLINSMLSRWIVQTIHLNFSTPPCERNTIKATFSLFSTALFPLKLPLNNEERAFELE